MADTITGWINSNEVTISVDYLIHHNSAEPDLPPLWAHLDGEWQLGLPD